VYMFDIVRLCMLGMLCDMYVTSCAMCVVETGKNVCTCFFIVALHVYVELTYVQVLCM